MKKMYRCLWTSRIFHIAQSYTEAENKEEAQKKFEAGDDYDFDEIYRKGADGWEILEIEEEET